LPETATTNVDGQFAISSLTAKTAGTQTIQATVDTQPVTVSVAVTAGTYTLTMNPSALTQGMPERVTFALKIGSVPTAGKSVSFTANDNFIGLPETATTNVDGQFAISSLTAKTAGTQTIQATVDTQPVTISVAVTAGTYTLTMNPSALTQGTPASPTFTLKMGDLPVPNTKVTFTANPNFSNLPTGEQTTSPTGTLTVSNLTALASGQQTIQATVEGQNVSVTFNVTAPQYTLVAYGQPSAGAFTNGISTATIRVQLLNYGKPHTTATPVTWSVVSAANNGPVVSGYESKKTGLNWASSSIPPIPPEDELSTTATSFTGYDGIATVMLTDVMGQRTVAIQAKVTIASADYTVTQNVTFPNGPLAAFAGPPKDAAMSWLNAADACGTSAVDTTTPGYRDATKLPLVVTLQSVAKTSGKGAAYAAGWHTVAANYWTGVIASQGKANYVVLSSGIGIYSANTAYSVEGAVCLPR
jgi:hypothetical protein